MFMTELEMALAAIALVGLGAFLVGLVWIRLERLEAERKAKGSRSAPPVQEAFPFPEPGEIAALAGRDR